ncbi:SLBB domain-containing protein [Sphingomonas sp. MMS24-JH45]
MRRRFAGGFYTDPVVNVAVAAYTSRYVTVLGAVGQPGLVPIDRAYRVSEIMARVGGPQPTGDDNLVLRRADGREMILPIAAIATGEPQAHTVAAGDKLYIAQAPVYIAGAVDGAGIVQGRQGHDGAQGAGPRRRPHRSRLGQEGEAVPRRQGSEGEAGRSHPRGQFDLGRGRGSSNMRDAAEGALVSADLHLLSEPAGLRAESIRVLRTHLTARRLRDGRRSLAVCAPTPTSGCTSRRTSPWGWRGGGGAGLIDGNLRAPGLARFFGVGEDEPGLADCLADPDLPLRDALHEDIVPGLACSSPGG